MKLKQSNLCYIFFCFFNFFNGNFFSSSSVFRFVVASRTAKNQFSFLTEFKVFF